MSIKYSLTWIAVYYLKRDECVKGIDSFLNLFMEHLMTLSYVMTDWFNFRLQAIIY